MVNFHQFQAQNKNTTRDDTSIMASVREDYQNLADINKIEKIGNQDQPIHGAEPKEETELLEAALNVR